MTLISRLLCHWSMFLFAFAGLSLQAFGSTDGSGDAEAHSSVILVGMSTALSGPASDLGNDVMAGVLAAFEETNRDGGVNGRRLELRVLDDGYEPSRTAPNMRRLIEHHKVVAVMGNVGTPTAIASIPIVNSTRTPFFAAYTGASVLRKNPPDRYVINYRASYAEETAAMVKALVEKADIAPNEIAFFTQRDGYGDAGFSGGLQALRSFGISDSSSIAHGRYERNTESIERALAEILVHRVPPKAVIMVGAYRPCAEFIKRAQSIDFEPLFLNVSFVGSNSLARALGGHGDGVIITQVVPHPQTNSKLAKQYREMHTFSSKDAVHSHGAFEGYISARIFIRALHKIEGPPTRESVVDAIESLGKFQLGDLRLKLDPDDHQASKQVWPTVITNGKVVPATWDQISNVQSRSVR